MTQAVDSLTQRIADFVVGTTFSSIDQEVMHLGKKSILDALGPAIAGSRTRSCRILQSYLSNVGIVMEGAGVFGTPLRMPARFAALANGTAMHADDFDDTMQADTGKFQGIHPTAPVFSAVLAQAEMLSRPVSGSEFLTAYHVGVEVACKLFDATAPQHILGGFHSTGTCGLLGAAAGVCRLMEADGSNIRMTLGIAASQAAGLQENFGTMTKPFHAGRSAEGGVMAADLARAGFTASPIILEAKRGFFSAYGGGYEQERIDGRLGAPWSFVDRGIWLKPWPTGSLGHPAMTLFLDLVRRNDIQAENVERIVVRTSENIHRTLLHHRPKTELEAKFSLEFCIASIVLNRALGLGDFTNEFVGRSEIQRLVQLIEYQTFTEAEARAEGYTIVTTLGDIELRDGRLLSGRRDYGKGSKADPMSDDEVEAKFLDCASFAGFPVSAADEIVRIMDNLETLDDVKVLGAALLAN